MFSIAPFRPCHTPFTQIVPGVKTERFTNETLPIIPKSRTQIPPEIKGTLTTFTSTLVKVVQTLLFTSPALSLLRVLTSKNVP